MRLIALMAALTVLTGCSQSAPTATPVPSVAPDAPAAGAAGSKDKPAGAKTPAAQTDANGQPVPEIEYPAGIEPETPGDGTEPTDGIEPVDGAPVSPVPEASFAPPVPKTTPPPATPSGITLMLDKQALTLDGGVHNLSNASTNVQNNQLVYHYGATPDKFVTGKAAAGIQVVIQLPRLPMTTFRQTDITSAVVTYMQVDAQGNYTERTGTFMKSDGKSSLNFEVEAANGKLTFTAKGLLLNDASGWGGTTSQTLVDWTMKDLPLEPPPATPAEGDGTDWW